MMETVDEKEGSPSKDGSDKNVCDPTDKQAAEITDGNNSTKDISSHSVNIQNDGVSSKDPKNPEKDNHNNTSVKKQNPKVDKTACLPTVEQTAEIPVSDINISTPTTVSLHFGGEGDGCNSVFVTKEDPEVDDSKATESEVHISTESSSSPVEIRSCEDSTVEEEVTETDDNDSPKKDQADEVDGTAITDCDVQISASSPLQHPLQIQDGQSTTCSMGKKIKEADAGDSANECEADAMECNTSATTNFRKTDDESPETEACDKTSDTAGSGEIMSVVNDTEKDSGAERFENVMMENSTNTTEELEKTGNATEVKEDIVLRRNVDQESGKVTTETLKSESININELVPVAKDLDCKNNSGSAIDSNLTENVSHGVKLDNSASPTIHDFNVDGSEIDFVLKDSTGDENSLVVKPRPELTNLDEGSSLVSHSNADQDLCLRALDAANGSDSCSESTIKETVVEKTKDNESNSSADNIATQHDSKSHSDWEVNNSDIPDRPPANINKSEQGQPSKNLTEPEVRDSPLDVNSCASDHGDGEMGKGDHGNPEIADKIIEGKDVINEDHSAVFQIKNTESEQDQINAGKCLAKESLKCEVAVVGDVSECLKDIVTRVSESHIRKCLAFERKDQLLCEQPKFSEISNTVSSGNADFTERRELYFDTSLESECKETGTESLSSCNGPSREERLDDSNFSQISATKAFHTFHLQTELQSKDIRLGVENKDISNEGHANANSDEKTVPPNADADADESKCSKVIDTGISNPPGFILSSPYTQTVEEYDALGHVASGSPKCNQDTQEKNTLEDNTSGSKDGHNDKNLERSDEDDGKNSEEDEYGVAKKSKTSKNGKAKSPEKGNVFIGYSKKRGKFKCFLCDERGSGSSFEEHVMQHILWKPYKCLYCVQHQYFITRSDIGKHVADAHKGKLPKCGLRAIRKAKEYMEAARKDGTFTNFNAKLNDMYWSCKQTVADNLAEKIEEPLNAINSEELSEKADITSDGASRSVDSKTIVENAENVETSNGNEKMEESEIIEKGSPKETVTAESVESFNGKEKMEESEIIEKGSLKETVTAEGVESFNGKEKMEESEIIEKSSLEEAFTAESVEVLDEKEKMEESEITEKSSLKQTVTAEGVEASDGKEKIEESEIVENSLKERVTAESVESLNGKKKMEDSEIIEENSLKETVTAESVESLNGKEKIEESEIIEKISLKETVTAESVEASDGKEKMEDSEIIEENSLKETVTAESVEAVDGKEKMEDSEIIEENSLKETVTAESVVASDGKEKMEDSEIIEENSLKETVTAESVEASDGKEKIEDSEIIEENSLKETVTAESVEAVDGKEKMEDSEIIEENSLKETVTAESVEASDGKEKMEESEILEKTSLKQNVTAESVEASDGKEKIENSEILEKNSLKETVTAKVDTPKVDSGPSVKDHSAATLMEPNVIQPRSQDFVTQLTKPQINELIALYHEENNDTTSSDKVAPLTKSVELIKVQGPQDTVSLTTDDCQKKMDSSVIQEATPATIVSRSQPLLGSNSGTVVTVSTSPQQVPSCPTVLHVVNSAAIGPGQVPQRIQAVGSQCFVNGQVPPMIAPRMILPVAKQMVVHANSNQLTPNLMTVQPNLQNMQKNNGNAQSVFAIPNVSPVVSPVGINPVSMPLNIPTSNILTIIPRQQFVPTVSKVLTATAPTPAVVQGQNTLIFVPFNSNASFQNLSENNSQSIKDIAPRRMSSERQSTSMNRPSYPNILSKSQVHMNLPSVPLAPPVTPVPSVTEKPIQPSNVMKSNTSSVIIQHPQRFAVGLVHNDFVCVPCKARFKHETSFRAHLWNHLHTERKPCAMCISSVNTSGRKTLACARTEEYLEKLKNAKIGSTAHVDVVVPPFEKSSTAVQNQADQNLTSQSLFPPNQSVLSGKRLPHEQTGTKLTMLAKDSNMSHIEGEKQDFPKISSSETIISSESSQNYTTVNAGTSGKLVNTDNNVSATRMPPAFSKESSVNSESRPNVSIKRTELSSGSHSHVNRENTALVIRELSHNDTTASVSKDTCPVNRDDAAALNSRGQTVSGSQGTLPAITGKSESVSGELKKKSTKWQFYVCGSGCGYSSLFSSELRRHIERCKNPMSLSCYHCQYYADNPDSLIRHLPKHYLAHAPGIAVHSCFVSKCQFTTNILQGYYQHVINTHPYLERFDCSNCKESFPDLKSLMDHLQANLLHVVNCRHCNAKDLVKSVIMSHIILSHPDKCKMANMVKQLLCKDRKDNREILKHRPMPVTLASTVQAGPTGQPIPDSEEEVNESFGLEIHQDESPAAATEENNTESHVPSKDPVHECCVCSYVGESKQDVDTHMSKHAENPAVRTLAFSCPECPEEFNLLTNFQTHLRKHANTLSYDVCSCQICKMKKGSRDNVEKHIRAMHNMVIGDGKEFIDIKLKVSNSDVVKCKVCRYKCLGQENLEKHHQKYHIARGVALPRQHSIELEKKKKTSDSSERTAGTLEATENIRMHIPTGSVFINPVRCVKCNFSSVYKGNIQRHLDQFHPDVELVVKQGKVSSPGKVMIQPTFDDDEQDDTLKIGGRVLDNELEWLYENHGTTFKCMMCLKDIQRKNVLHNHLLEHLGMHLWKCTLCDYNKTSRRVVAMDHVKNVHPGQCDTDVIIAAVDEIKAEIGNRLGRLFEHDREAKNIRPSLGTKELDNELKSKYKVIGKKKICKTCDAEYQSSYAVHSHILRRHLKLFMFKCNYCDFSAVDRYSVSKHSKDSHPDLEIVVQYDPTKTKGKDQKIGKNSGKRKTSSEKQSLSVPSQLCTEKSVPVENNGTISHSDVVSSSGAEGSFTDNGVTSISDSVHCSSGKTLHPHDSDAKNELRVGSDHLDQKLRTMYDLKPGRARILVCNTCHTEHYSKYTLHCDLLDHLKVNLVACPYCTFESIENKQLTEHINIAHPDQRVYFLYLQVSIEDATKRYVDTSGSQEKPVKKQQSPKPKTPHLSQLLGGVKVKNPVKHHKSPEKLSKNVVSVMTGGLKKFKCKLCDYMALTKNSVGTHIFKVHENSGKTSCQTVPQKSSVPEKLSCNFCQFKSSLPEVLRNHYKEKHPLRDARDDRNEDQEPDHVKLHSSDKRKKQKSGSREDKSNSEKHSQSQLSNPLPLKQKSDKQKDKDVTVATLKKPELILERLEDEIGTGICESVKLKKRKEKDKTRDQPPAKKIKATTDIVTYRCPKCDFKDESKENAVDHLKSEHGATKLMQCAYCTASYLYEGKLSSHIKFLHKGKDVNYQLLPLESMLNEEHISGDNSGKSSQDSTGPKKSNGHKNSEKNQKSGHSSKHAKVTTKTDYEEKKKSKHSKDSSNYQSKSSTTSSGQEGKPEQNHSKTSKDVLDTTSHTKTVASKASKSSSELKVTQRGKAASEMPRTAGSKLSTNASVKEIKNPTKSASTTSSKDKSGETQVSKIKKKSMTTHLPPYIPSSPDNSDDEKGDYYKYLCVYCDFKENKRSVMKLHLADHSIKRLYDGKLPESEEARIRVRNKVRDIMPICKERARNKQEKIVDDSCDPGTADKCDESTSVKCSEGTTNKCDEGTAENIPEVKLKEERISPKKRTVAAPEKEASSMGNSSSEDSDAEIGRPKKKRKTKRVLSSSEEESDTEVKSQPKKHILSPSGGQLTYCCHLCNYKGKSLYRFRSHLASHGTFKYLDADMSNASNLKCGFCGFLADDKEGFSHHVEKHLDGRIYKCGYCKYDSYHSKNMKSHLKNNHRHKPEKIIDLRQVLKERAQRPSQVSQLVNLDPELCLVDSLKNGDMQSLLEEACGMKGVLDMPIHMLPLIGQPKITDIYLDSSDDEYVVESDDDVSTDENSGQDSDDDEEEIIFIN